MNMIGMLLLVATTATSQFGQFGAADVGGKRLHRHHLVKHGPPPPGGMIGAGGINAAGGCLFGHAGCAGGAACPGGAGGAGGAGMPGTTGRRFPNVRSQLFFVDPTGMKIGWQTTGGGVERVYLPGQLTVPARYNFNQGYIYRLKLNEIPDRPGLVLYPTLEVAPSTPATDAFLTHNPIPVQFLDEDFDQVQAGNFVTKVIYLPDPRFQELAIAGVETLVSTRLEPGVDPILEADRRGTILLIVRLGAIDLEMPQAGAVVPGSVVTAPGGVIMAPGSAPGTVLPPGTLPEGTFLPDGTVLPPGSLPPGAGPFNPQSPPPTPPPVTESVPVDTAAPVTPVPPTAPPAEAPPPPAPETEPAAPSLDTPPPAENVPPPAENMPPPAENVPPPADNVPPPAAEAPPLAELPLTAPKF
jgi:hypothetical protein